MKFKTLKYSLVVFLLAVSVSLQASKNSSESKLPQSVLSLHYMLDQYGLDEFVIAGAMTTGNEYERLFGGQMSADYRFTRKFSLGVQGNFYVLSTDLNEPREYALALRTNYHIVKFERFKPNPFDVYIGLSFGSEVYPSQVKFTEGFIAAHLGARYKLDDKWMVFSEVGTRNSSIGLAYSF